MLGNEALELELKRLRRELETATPPDATDVAAVEALASKDIQDLLIPILNDGAYLAGVRLEPAGVMEGLVQINFECNWLPGTSRMTAPPVVSALVEVEPPRVLKVERFPSRGTSGGMTFGSPAGAVPPVLQNVSPLSPTEATYFMAAANEGFEYWATANEMTDLSRKKKKGPQMVTTGSRCTSLLCTEREMDDTTVIYRFDAGLFA